MLVRRQDLIQEGGDPVDSFLNALSHMAARMEIINIPRQILHPLQVVFHRHKGKLPHLFICGTSIQGVGGMCHDLFNFMFFCIGKVRSYVLLIYGFCFAAPGISRKKLECVCPDGNSFLPHM